MGYRLGCLFEMRKLLEFDFSAAIDGVVKDGIAKIEAAEDEVLDERIVNCKKWVLPPDHFDSYSIFKHSIL
ncbi:L-type lectin-domain containing receptor kinase S.5 [Pyrus ussuriensis x Pyrus communis]|uniref:L-type lectin-domain containing receptor kinase S.5 n=1 Tax=Pyrus ussuriensis x Pyrus communis TaxID=2448454 RepID=A0A5N5I7W0_9ROSA|nr:L-type lectin-domain containing receptor kinase S.5 [Pyrus ussuriensis x Pyrus communis]